MDRKMMREIRRPRELIPTIPRAKGSAESKGSWREIVVQPDIFETLSPDDLINRVLSTNLIARPLINIYNIGRTLAIVLSSKPGKRPHDLIEAIKTGIDIRINFNKARINKIKENWGVR